MRNDLARDAEGTGEQPLEQPGGGSGAPAPGVLPERAQMVELHRSYCVATWGYMLIAVFNGAVRGKRVEAVIEAARRNCRRFPMGGGFILLIGPNAGLPDAEARRLTSEALSELGDYVHSAAVVIDWDGFRAATARSAVSTMFLATGRRLTMKVFRSVSEATAWQTGTVRNEPPFESERYLEVVEECRERQAAFRERHSESPA